MPTTDPPEKGKMGAKRLRIADPPNLVLFRVPTTGQASDVPPEPTPEQVAEARAAAVDEGDYAATDRQVRLRYTAEACAKNGQGTPPEWVAAHATSEHRETIRLAEFERWRAIPGFTRWFYANMRWKPDAVDLEALHGALFRKVVQGVGQGDMRSMELAADLLGVRQRAKDGTGGSVHEAVREFMDRGQKAGKAASPSARGLKMDEGTG